MGQGPAKVTIPDIRIHVSALITNKGRDDGLTVGGAAAALEGSGKLEGGGSALGHSSTRTRTLWPRDCGVTAFTVQ